jgi:hypothetical protein
MRIIGTSAADDDDDDDDDDDGDDDEGDEGIIPTSLVALEDEVQQVIGVGAIDRVVNTLLK